MLGFQWGFCCCLFFQILRSWYKGNDTTTLCEYLAWKMQNVIPTLETDALPYFLEMAKLFNSANAFMRILYNANLWLSRKELKEAIANCEGLLVSFETLAQMAFDSDICRFKLQPKFHLVGELLYFMKLDQLHNRPNLNVLAFATQMDEDFVGRIAHLSRYVSSRSLHEKTLRRYLLALKSSWT